MSTAEQPCPSCGNAGQPGETATERIERLGYDLGSITGLLEEAHAVWFVDRAAARLRVQAALAIARADGDAPDRGTA